MINLSEIICEECGAIFDTLYKANIHAGESDHAVRDDKNIEKIKCECGAIIPNRFYADRHFQYFGHKEAAKPQ